MENKKISLKKDLVHLIANTAIVYFGIAGLKAYDEGTSFTSQLTDNEPIFYSLTFAALFTGWKIGRRFYEYFKKR